MHKRKIILASESPWRRKILADAGISFTVEKSGYRENMKLNLSPSALAQKLALGKAMAVAKRHSDAVVIGADTFVVYKKNLLGKPGSRARAISMLKKLSGSTHSLLTGFAIVDSRTLKYVVRTAVTKVTMKKLSIGEISYYVDTGESLRAAGGYAIQDNGKKLIARIRGSVDNVAGLPLKELLVALKKFHVPSRV